MCSKRNDSAKILANWHSRDFRNNLADESDALITWWLHRLHGMAACTVIFKGKIHHTLSRPRELENWIHRSFRIILLLTCSCFGRNHNQHIGKCTTLYSSIYKERCTARTRFPLLFCTSACIHPELKCWN